MLRVGNVSKIQTFTLLFVCWFNAVFDSVNWSDACASCHTHIVALDSLWSLQFSEQLSAMPSFCFLPFAFTPPRILMNSR